ncbi:MAG: FAD-dependent oxidoreductase [Microbacteriaceae bacterium]|nr:FAD-dependent oxidoreductase [Microbacteriaceae bacterium]
MARVLVVGSGIAGLTAARVAAEAGHAVTVLTKHAAETGSTAKAQGGVAAAVFADDTAESHIADTLAAGAGHCDPEAVRVLCEEGPARVHELAALGVEFDADAAGGWLRGLEAAHSSARVVHAGGDATGAHIEDAVLAAARAAGVEVREGVALRDLVVRDGRVVGVEALVVGAAAPAAPGAAPGETGAVAPAVEVLEADAVVLATGGFGALYPRTSNPASATGDGIAAALRAGAAVADLEFVQFHPTVLAVGEPFLVSEAVRGEGAALRDCRGHRFMTDVDPRAELAPRDVVAREIARAMARCDGEPVGLDATTIAPAAVAAADAPVSLAAALARRFPTIDAAVRERGLDWSRAPVPVRPGSHFAMGGVAVDLDGRTTLPGLWAVGETACNGVHGANRLASNSLLEGAVFGARVGAAVGREPPDAADRAPAAVRDGAATLDELLAAAPIRPALADAVAAPATPGRDPERPVLAGASLAAATPGRMGAGWSREALRALMWRDVGLERDAAGLARAASTIARWRAGTAEAVDTAEAADPAAALAALEDANLLVLAAAVTASAQRRPRSLGAHFRGDDLAAAGSEAAAPASAAPASDGPASDDAASDDPAAERAPASASRPAQPTEEPTC